jgi:SOS response regulatory protein OraA/RecX
MAALKYLKESKDSRLLLLGIVEEGESANYTVDATAYEAIGSPRVGEWLDGGMMEIIKGSDELIRARKKALSILAYADNSRYKLYTKLVQAGFSSSVAKETVAYTVDLGYIRERDQIERKVLSLANESLKGERKIVMMLSSHGYQVGQIIEVIKSLVDDGSIDFSANAARLLEKKHCDPSDLNEKKKILYNYGYKL